MTWRCLPVPSHPGRHPGLRPTVLPLPPPGAWARGPGLGAAAGGGLVVCWLVRLRPRGLCLAGISFALIWAEGSLVLWAGEDLVMGRAWGAFLFAVETVWMSQDTGLCGFGFIVHLQGDGGVKAAPSGAVLVDLESGIGRGTGLATGGGGGSKNDPGTLPWPLPLGCEQHK